MKNREAIVERAYALFCFVCWSIDDVCMCRYKSDKELKEKNAERFEQNDGGFTDEIDLLE